MLNCYMKIYCLFVINSDANYQAHDGAPCLKPLAIETDKKIVLFFAMIYICAELIADYEISQFV